MGGRRSHGQKRVAVSVSDHIFNQIKSKTTTMEVWDAIKAIYETGSKTRMIIEDLHKKLQNSMLGDNDDAHAHFSRLTDLRERLASMGENLDDEKFAFILLCSLPSSYRSVISIMVIVADCTGNPVTPDQIIGLVTEEYDRRAIKKGNTGSRDAFATNSLKRRDKRNVECSNCHKLGHYKSDCWAKGGDKEGQRPARRSNGNNVDNRNNQGRNDRNYNRNSRSRINDRNDDHNEENITAANDVDIEDW